MPMKLVRDGIANISEVRRHHRFQTIKSDDKFLKILKQKLVEEAKEAFGAQTKDEIISELVDVLEVTEEIEKLLGVTVEQVKLLQKKKKTEKGGFVKRLMMLSR